MCAVARNLYLSPRIFAALAAILFVICYGAPACRVRTFVLLNICHNYLPSLQVGCRDKKRQSAVSESDSFRGLAGCLPPESDML
jgi:hypothetical protein